MAKTFGDMAPVGVLPLIDRSFTGAGLGEIRHELGNCASASGLADVALAHFVVAVNEITTNAVRHAGGHGHLRLWRHGDALFCEVVDKGPGISKRQLNDTKERRPGRIGGHGLWLARHICDDVQIETGRGTGTRVLLRYVLPTT
jgi:serine/threonine-protein kinase RsbW